MVVARYFFLVAHYFLLVVHYFLLVARWFLLAARYFLLIARYVLLFARYFFPAFMGYCPTISHTCYPYLHYIKYARIQVFTDPYSPVQGQNRRFCPCTGDYGSVKTRILAYFIQCYLVYEFFIFSFLVLLKEIRTRSE